VYVPCIYVLNKIDQITIEELFQGYGVAKRRGADDGRVLRKEYVELKISSARLFEPLQGVLFKPL